QTAQRLGIRSLSDLARHAELKLGLSHEFLERADGWPAVSKAYDLRQEIRGLDHDVVYRALISGAVDAVDLYSTDPEIRRYGLRVPADDRKQFPDYPAVLLFRQDLAPAARRVLGQLEGHIPVEQMIAMNARVTLERATERRAAAEFLRSHLSFRPVGRD